MTTQTWSDQVWVVVEPIGTVEWAGMAQDEHLAWFRAYSWLNEDGHGALRRGGHYAARATLTWSKPE